MATVKERLVKIMRVAIVLLFLSYLLLGPFVMFRLALEVFLTVQDTVWFTMGSQEPRLQHCCPYSIELEEIPLFPSEIVQVEVVGRNNIVSRIHPREFGDIIVVDATEYMLRAVEVFEGFLQAGDYFHVTQIKQSRVYILEVHRWQWEDLFAIENRLRRFNYTYFPIDIGDNLVMSMQATGCISRPFVLIDIYAKGI